MFGWKRIIAIIIGVSVWCSELKAQYKVSGVVKDAHSQEIIPFAPLQFEHTQTGMVTNTEGKYMFELNVIPSDTLLVRVMGYTILRMPVNRQLKEQVINFELTRSDLSLKTYEVKANVNFALILLKQIVKHKPENNYNRLDNYKYEVYNKLELDMKSLNKEKLSRNRFTKPFAFILNNIDSTSEDKPFLPIFLTESLSDYYFQSSPHKTKEIIKAARTSGIDNESVTKFLGGMYQNINIYDNFIPVFDKQFVSPIHHNGAFYYDYKIADTQYVSGQRYIKLNFTPKRKGENTFIGDLWVHDTTYAVQKTTLSVPKDANLNFVRRVSVIQEFRQMPDSSWFLYKDKFIADFWAPSPKPGKTFEFIGRKTTTYDNVVTSDTSVTNIFSNKRYPESVVVLDSARVRKESFWQDNRPDSLSKNEMNIYKMVDTLQRMPLFQKYSNTIKFLATGYKPFGPIEWGPYYYLFSKNRLEGFRLRLDLGTTQKFNKDLYLYGYLAYGFDDKVFKGKISGLWLLKRHPRMYIYGAYTKDLDNGSHYYDEVGTDNIFTLAIRKGGIPQKFLMIQEQRLEFFKEYYSGFSHQLSLIHKQVRPYEPLPTAAFYPKLVNGRDPLTNTEVELKLRYAFHEQFLEGSYYRISLGSKYPITELKLAVGIPGIGNSGQDYQRVTLSVSDNVKLPPFGSLYYNVFGGKIFGTVPYTSLEVHPGNEMYYYNKYAFNMMNRFEFISDQYAGFNVEHTIGNGIFGYIPLIKKLKWRQFWTAKGVIGSLSDANKQLNLNKGYTFKTLEGDPYLEVGTGIENIFKFLRVDFVWRVTPGQLPDEPASKRFGVFGSFKLQF
ncbi:MAG TPA: DUF5686 family protein [Chitinophaga sp.]|uniref:DUF5686 family protein n=1 Tax=Chitinophaga sp. TaxID=1869181 RepID=UPI002B7EE36A|nr:DUF5686 family protein [Chitinophaga sp.]HVI45416.1 DUF5686 family protein [Chitinophaga sp.]